MISLFQKQVIGLLKNFRFLLKKKKRNQWYEILRNWFGFVYLISMTSNMTGQDRKKEFWGMFKKI